MKEIKRYKNRRLYDPEKSKVITHVELAQMVKEGVEFKIIDTSSGEDVTLAVLGRVLLNESLSWEDIKQSKEIFSQIISLGGEKSMSLFKNTILASIGAFQVTKAKAEQIIDDLIKKGELDKSDRKKAIMELLAKAEKSTAKLKEKVTTEADKATKDIQKLVKEYKFVKQTDYKKLETKVTKLTKVIKKLEEKIESLTKE